MNYLFNEECITKIFCFKCSRPTVAAPIASAGAFQVVFLQCSIVSINFPQHLSLGIHINALSQQSSERTFITMACLIIYVYL